ncbi:MAG: DUF5996 family protein [Gemmatimonadaceae bacterium]
MSAKNPDAAEIWPALPLEAWRDTRDTLHMWMQIVGKVKLELCPFLNEWWEVPLFLSPRGLTTSTIPFARGVFAIDFDFLDHNLYVRASDGAVEVLPLIPRSVADFYAEFMAALRALGIEVTLNALPQQVEHPIPFDQDHEHVAYDRVFIDRWWRILTRVGVVMEQYRSGFTGKSSPVQFYWGDFDLSVTRFSGKPAQPPKGADRRVRFTEDEENVTSGFWPGGAKLAKPAFYSYTYPAPSGYKTASVRPGAARYDTKLGEFALNYDDVRLSPAPEKLILEFLQSTYEAGATLARWDRGALEHRGPAIGPQMTGKAGTNAESVPHVSPSP